MVRLLVEIQSGFLPYVYDQSIHFALLNSSVFPNAVFHQNVLSQLLVDELSLEGVDAGRGLFDLAIEGVLQQLLEVID